MVNRAVRGLDGSLFKRDRGDGFVIDKLCGIAGPSKDG